MRSQLPARTAVESETSRDVLHQFDAAIDFNANADQWAILGYLRFFLAACVAASHLYFVAETATLPPVVQWLRSFDATQCVFCFFLVSGFSIAASVGSGRDPKRFYLRRAWRIYPVYLTGLLIALIPFHLGKPLQLAGGPPITAPTAQAIAMNALGLPWIITPAVCTFNQSWSLTCEIVYYSLAPLIAKMQSKYIALTLLGSYMIYCSNEPKLWSFSYAIPVVALAWYWLAGFLIYRHRNALVPIAIFAALIWIDGKENLPMLVTLTAILFARQFGVNKSMAKAGSYLGDLSYPLYITHISVYIIAYLLIGSRLADFPGAYIVLALGVAVLIYNFVDLPTRKFKPGSSSICA